MKDFKVDKSYEKSYLQVFILLFEGVVVRRARL